MLTRLAILSVLFTRLAQPQTSKLATAETSITLEAATHAPLLMQIGNNWNNQAPQTLLGNIDWNLKQTLVTRTTIRFIYESSNPHLQAIWEWQARSTHGPIEHRIFIRNLGSTELWLPLQNVLAFDFKVPASESIQQFWVEKSASSPSSEGTHLITVPDHYAWTGTSSTYAHPPKGAQREFIPYVLVQRADQSGWYLGIEFSGRTRITLRRNAGSISGEAGLNPDPGPYKTRLGIGVTYETPTIFLGEFQGGPDGAGNILRRWIREVLNNPVTLRNPNYPMLVSNSWGSGMVIQEEQADRMIQDAAHLGLEMFHLDAGWFRTIGEWTANPQKFPHGIASVAGFAHKLGLKFGLWTDWSQAGNTSEHRDWLTVDPPVNWKPADFKGLTMDLGFPPVRDWASKLLTDLIGNFHLDMLEHDGYLVAQGCERQDHPHASLNPDNATHYRDEDFEWVSGPNDTDVSDHATRAYYQVQSELRRQFPNLLFEICNDGGRMVDFGSASHGDYFSITDAYDPIGNRRAFFDASYVLPPAMLETYVEKWPSATIANFRYMLRSGLMGWFSLMQDSSTWSPEQQAAAIQEFALYKSKLRPLIRNADLYHISNRPDGQHWDGIEYYDAATGNGVIYAFRSALAGDTNHTFKLRGLQPKHRYKLTFQDQTEASYTATAEQLQETGMTLHLPTANTSELVFVNSH